MSQDEFRITESEAGYRVELYRAGKRYVTFMDGLTQENAERAVRSLTALWAKISTPRPMLAACALESLVRCDDAEYRCSWP